MMVRDALERRQEQLVSAAGMLELVNRTAVERAAVALVQAVAHYDHHVIEHNADSAAAARAQLEQLKNHLTSAAALLDRLNQSARSALTYQVADSFDRLDGEWLLEAVAAGNSCKLRRVVGLIALAQEAITPGGRAPKLPEQLLAQDALRIWYWYAPEERKDSREQFKQFADRIFCPQLARIARTEFLDGRWVASTLTPKISLRLTG